MTPEFLKQIDWKLLQEQKQYLIDLDHPHADGVVSLLDSLQDYCVDVLGIDEGKIFSSLVNEPAKGLEVGVEYYLDDVEDVIGIFKGEVDGSYLFQPVGANEWYAVDDDGFIGFTAGNHYIYKKVSK